MNFVSLNNFNELNPSKSNDSDSYHSSFPFQQNTDYDLFSYPFIDNKEKKEDDNYLCPYYFKNNKEKKDKEEEKEKEKEEKSTGETGVGKKKTKNKGRKKLGQKTEREKNEKEEHNKYSYDNSIRKIKKICINLILYFINSKLFVIYNGNIGNGKNKKKLFLLNHEQIKNAIIEFNKNFLNKTLEEIFSENLSNRIKNYNIDHNRILIEILKNEEDEEKKEYFTNLFGLTFLDCLKYIRGNDDEPKYLYIKGLKQFDDLENDDEFRGKDGKEYFDHLKDLIRSYENVLRDRKGRKYRKNNNE